MLHFEQMLNFQTIYRNDFVGSSMHAQKFTLRVKLSYKRNLMGAQIPEDKIRWNNDSEIDEIRYKCQL